MFKINRIVVTKFSPHFTGRNEECGNLSACVTVALARTPSVVRGAPHGRHRERRDEDQQPDDLRL